MDQRRKLRKSEENSSAQHTPRGIRERSFQRAIKLLAARPRSIAELREKLLRGRSADKAVVEVVIERLREYGYLDDKRFAIGYAASKVRQRPIGRQRLQHDLALKKVDRAVAEEALDSVFAETSEEDLIDLAIEKRIRVRGRPKNRAEAKSLFDHLLRQGFPYDLALESTKALLKTSLDNETAAGDI
jgi:regulatory protein